MSAQIIATLSENLLSLETFAASLEGQNTSNVFVLENQGFYIKYANGDVNACGIVSASVFTFERASALAPRIKNGNNKNPEVIALGEALSKELQSLRDLLDDIKSRANMG